MDVSTNDAAYDAALAYARERGTDDGQNAAGWYVQETFGGHAYASADDAEGAALILRGIEDGDPAVLDTFPFADLSGEWADTLTGPQLVSEAVSEVDLGEDDARKADRLNDWFTDVCDAYENAFSDAVSAEIERAAREVVTD